MDRLGFVDPTSLTGYSRKLYEHVDDYFANLPYTWKLSNGNMVGPFGLELHTPGPGQAWLLMTRTLAAYTELPLLAREVAILVTGAHTQAAYEIYAHTAVSGLPDADIQQILKGVCPPHLDGKCQIAFEVATELCKPGVLPEATWNKALDVLGRQAAIAVVHYVGFYKYVATILNGFDAKVPQ